jgi:hypothetical protein
MTFQIMVPTRAENRTSFRANPLAGKRQRGARRSRHRVRATAVPNGRTPANSAAETKSRALPGLMERESTLVATTLLPS